MIKRLLLLVIIVFLSCSTCSVFAEEANFDQKQDFTPKTIGLTAFQRRLLDYLEIERHFLGRKHPKPSTEAWKDYTRLYEEYVTLFCYETADPKVFESSSPKISLNCRYYLDKLEAYHPAPARRTG